MCVIAVKPAGIDWPAVKYLKSCYSNNPHGAGIAWVDEAGLHVKKGYFGWRRLWHDLRVLEPYSVVLHCRIATHGSVSAENCHPFMLSNGVAMAHNGIINIKPAQKNMTDSETFGRQVLERFSVEGLEEPHIRWLLEQAIGYSKVVLLKNDGKTIILNRDLGETFQGVWFSNNSFEPYEKEGAFGAFWFEKGALREQKSSKVSTRALDYDDGYEEYMTTKYPESFSELYSDPFFVDDRLDFSGNGMPAASRILK